MNGKFLIISNSFPFVLRFSKDERSLSATWYGTDAVQVSGVRRNVSGCSFNRQRHVLFRFRNPLNNRASFRASWRDPRLREEARPGIQM